MDFSQQVVWITGASSGIGRSLAIVLSSRKARLVLSSRDTAALERVKKACQYPENVRVCPLDLSQPDTFQGKVAEAISFFGTVDVLVNNGGISQRSLAFETELSVDQRLMEVNYIGTVALTKALLPYFISQKSGHFVVTTSIVGKIGTPFRSSYAASKHALHGFFDSLRAEHHNDGLHVTLVCPGFVRTNISKNALLGNGAPQAKMDMATANGIDPDRFAELMTKAIYQKKQEVYLAGAKEKLGVYVKRFAPTLFSVLVRKLSVR